MSSTSSSSCSCSTTSGLGAGGGPPSCVPEATSHTMPPPPVVGGRVVVLVDVELASGWVALGSVVLEAVVLEVEASSAVALAEFSGRGAVALADPGVSDVELEGDVELSEASLASVELEGSVLSEVELSGVSDSVCVELDSLAGRSVSAVALWALGFGEGEGDATGVSGEGDAAGASDEGEATGASGFLIHSSEPDWTMTLSTFLVAPDASVSWKVLLSAVN